MYHVLPAFQHELSRFDLTLMKQNPAVKVFPHRSVTHTFHDTTCKLFLPLDSYFVFCLFKLLFVFSFELFTVSVSMCVCVCVCVCVRKRERERERSAPTSREKRTPRARYVDECEYVHTN